MQTPAVRVWPQTVVRVAFSVRVCRACGFMLVAAHTAAVAAPAALHAGLESALARVNEQAPGCVIGVARDGERAVLARGQADLERGSALTADSVLEAGSVAKQFTAYLVLLLAKEGKLSLDDPLARHLPEFAGLPAGAATLRQAMQHTAGLRDWGSLVAFEGWPRGTRDISNTQVRALLARQRSLNFAPGTQWSYSNSGYQLAAEVLARVSGSDFATLSRERLFMPLGLLSTHWRADPNQLVLGRALAYEPAAAGWRLAMPGESAHGAGGLLSTVSDLLSWAEELRQPRRLDPQLVAQMLAPALTADGHRLPYGLGLDLGSWRGLAEFGHGGATAGYRAQLRSYPETRISVAMLCNRSDAATGSMARVAVLAALPPGAVAPEVTAPAFALTPAQAAAFVGPYRHPANGQTRRIDLQDGVLRVPGAGVVQPLAVNRVRLAIGIELQLEADGLRLRTPDGREETWARVHVSAPSAAALAASVGRYRSDEVQQSYSVVQEGQVLLLLGPAGEKTRLEPRDRDNFETPLASVRFEREANGVVSALVFGEARVWALRFVRDGPAPKL